MKSIDLSLLLTQLRKSGVLRKVTEIISLKKMAKGFIATKDDPWIESALRDDWIYLRPKYGNEVRGKYECKIAFYLSNIK